MTTVGLSQGKYPRMLFRATFLHANMNIMTFSFHLYITDTIPRDVPSPCCLLSLIQY